MKILLLNPPIREWARPNCFPTGLGYVAACLRSAGHEVEVMDINATDALRRDRPELERRIAEARFDMIGAGGLVTTYRFMKWLGEVIRKHHPDAPMVLGGSVATSVPHVVLEHTEWNIAAVGEGEITAVELADALEHGKSLESVAGIQFRDQGQIVKTATRAYLQDLDTTPFPAWDLFPMDVYLGNVVGAPNKDKWDTGADAAEYRSMNVSGTRGCPYKCIYCYHDFLGARYRLRSPQNILDEIKTLIDRYGVRYIDFNDDCFVINRNFVYEFCDLVLKENVKFDWGIAGRVNLVDRELFERIKAAGCISSAYGIESGSQKMLDLMKKKVTVEQAEAALTLTEEFFGENLCTLIIGLPGETRDTVEETIAFCERAKLTPEAVFFATAYPGTELYDIALKRGMIPDEEEYILKLWEQGENMLLNFTDFKDDELIALKKEMSARVGAKNVRPHDEYVPKELKQ